MTHDPAFERTYQDAASRARERSAELEGPSLLERLARLPPITRDAVLGQLSTSDLARLAYDWATIARPKQDPHLEHVVHRILFFMAGRGFGKTMSGAQRMRRRIYAGARSLAFVAPTLGEAEKYMLGVGQTDEGLLNIFPPSQRPRYNSVKKRVTFHTGAVAEVNTAEEPEFRGANLDSIWADEPGKWRYLDTIWENIESSVRKPGVLPLELVITGTPVPKRRFKEWIADEHTVTILGRTAENASNVDPLWLKKRQEKLAGTRLGRQELDGELLGDNPGALFRASKLEEDRVETPPLGLRTVVIVDPAQSTHHRTSDETGIVVEGIDDDTGHIYVLADLSEKMAPEKWGATVIGAYEQWGCEAVVVERNRGGDMVAATVRASMERKRGGVAAQAIPIKEVHAHRSAGKGVRAEPVSALHQRGYLHMVGGFPELEGEATEWDPSLGGVSPNRLDAMVWGVWYLGRLGEEHEAPKDYRRTMQGIATAQAAITGRAADRGIGVLVTALPSRSGWGSL